MIIDKIRLRKSAGVRVSLGVHAILRRANAARDVREYRRAALLFREALDRDPLLAHVWIQYGHMLRELDEHREAEAAYREALEISPGPEPHLHLGHIFKTQGQVARAARSYLAAAKADPSNGDALAELHRCMARNIEITAEDIMALTDFEPHDAAESADPLSSAALRARSALDSLALTLRQEGSEEQQALLENAQALIEKLEPHAIPLDERSGDDQSGISVVFDVSDLISYFANARLPTGIQRVQIEAIRNALRDPTRTIKVCAFLDTRDEWVEISASTFLSLCRLSLSSGDLNAPEWVGTLARLRLTMTMADALEFPQGAFLVNLGTSWWLQNYFLYVRQAKAKFGIHYVPFVHDVIPVMASEHCTRELTQDFISWAVGAFEHADFFFVNSEATKRDLLKVAETLGHELDAEKIVVIRLDADFRKPVAKPLAGNELAKWGIGRSDFVLFVSTIESRKNHIGAFDAWIDLIRKHGGRRVPRLVCVGNRGWLNDAIYARLAAHEGLRERVVMLSGLSDAELDLLYRSCLFTLYPSNYEGWGLPVTESLCYGKVPLISDASSLPEAGGAFADYFEAGSTPRLTSALEALIYDADHRKTRESNIAEGYKPRRWADIADQMMATLTLWAEEADQEGRPTSAPLALINAYHPIVRNFASRIWRGMRSAEVFRAGSGWWGPDDWGCWTKASGGLLEIGIPDEAKHELRLYIQLHGLPSRSCRWTAILPDLGLRQEGELLPGAFKWISFDIPDLPPDRILRIAIEGQSVVDLRTVTDGGDPRIVSVGVTGFYICEASDALARSTFLEAVALSNIEDIAFNRETPDSDLISTVLPA